MEWMRNVDKWEIRLCFQWLKVYIWVHSSNALRSVLGCIIKCNRGIESHNEEASKHLGAKEEEIAEVKY